MLRPISNLARVRIATACLVLSGIAFLVPAASAEVVRMTFTGVVTEASGAYPDMLDLQNAFSPGQPITIAFSIDRSVPGGCPERPDDPTWKAYGGALSDLDFSFGSYGATTTCVCQTPGSSVVVCNGRMLQNSVGLDPADLFQVQTLVSTAPALGEWHLTFLNIDLLDWNASAFSSTELPRRLPALEGFEMATCRLEFWNADETRWGYVSGLLSSSAAFVPANLTTWGRVKSGYRN